MAVEPELSEEAIQRDPDEPAPMAKREYKESLRDLQVELVKVQKHVIKHGHKLLLIFEGRDASGKDGAIKRIVQHLSPRETRVVALGPPADRDRASWYFQRYVAALPAAQEMVLFNRSWYNRAGVERVMGFCTAEEHASFIEQVAPFEQMLIRSGIQIVKYYLDVGRKEQKRRLRQRGVDPLKQWKVSPIDSVALERWDDYTQARDEMLELSSRPPAPWIIIKADDKRSARLNIIRDLLTRVECPKARRHLADPDREIAFEYSPAQLHRLAR